MSKFIKLTEFDTDPEATKSIVALPASLILFMRSNDNGSTFVRYDDRDGGNDVTVHETIDEVIGLSALAA